MMKSEVDVLCELTNNVILRTSGRNFPGMVVQGDQLRGLLRLAERALEQMRLSAPESNCDDLEELEESLRERVELYERILNQNGLELPYPDRVTPETKSAAG